MVKRYFLLLNILDKVKTQLVLASVYDELEATYNYEAGMLAQAEEDLKRTLSALRDVQYRLEHCEWFGGRQEIIDIIINAIAAPWPTNQEGSAR